MDLILVGPGRAGLALSLRLVGGGHTIVGVLARDPAAAASAAERLGSEPLQWGEDLPTVELMLIAVRDDAITDVAQRVASNVAEVGGAVHLSGLIPIEAIGALHGPSLGSFHPLQTLPTPEAGAARLEGAWVAVTTRDDRLADLLFGVAASIGMHPFELTDEAKPLYHAAAAASANYPLAALSIAKELFEAAGVPFEVAGPLVSAVVSNAMSMGPGAALTGPIARGDVGTVRAQIAAIEKARPDLAAPFKAFGRITAVAAGTAELMEAVLE